MFPKTGDDVMIGDLMKTNNNGDVVDTNNNNRLISVSRASGGKERHSKVWTFKGPRERRVRLSVSTALQFYDLQDRLGLDQPSKAVEWLIKAAEDSISELPSLNNTNFPMIDDDDNQNQIQTVTVAAARDHTTTTSFTDLLNSGSDPVNINRQWMAPSSYHAQMEYLSSGLILGSGQTHFPVQTNAPHPFSDHHQHPHQEFSQAGSNGGGAFNLDFNMSTTSGVGTAVASAGFSGFNRGTLQSNSSNHQQQQQSFLASLQRFSSSEESHAAESIITVKKKEETFVVGFSRQERETSFQDLEAGRGGRQDTTQAVASGIFQINTSVSSFQRLVNTLGTPKDTPELRDKLHKTRLHIGQLVKDTASKLKEACETDHQRGVNQKKKIVDAQLAKDFQSVLKDFQSVLKEFQKAQHLAAERETVYAPLVTLPSPPSSYTHSEIDANADKHQEQRALLVESKRQELVLLGNEIAFNEAIIEEREQGIEEIQQQIGEVHEIFKDLAVLVHDQGTMIDDISTHIDNSHAATALGKSHLAKASKTQRSNSSLTCLLLVIFGIVLLNVIIVLAV